jgi:hypothetical protein
MQPQIISSFQPGEHCADLNRTVTRLKKEAGYKDLSCIWVTPAFGQIPTKTVASWLNVFTPPNGKFVRLFAVGMEVGEAFSTTIKNIVDHPELSKFKYIITVEHDNLPPPDGIVRLLSRMEANPEYACIGGLYFTKGPGGAAQIWGDVKDPVLNFRPQLPDPNGGLVECCGTGMGFNAWRVDMFKDPKIARPWFRTKASASEGVGTQDLAFWSEARKHGYRCAVDCSVKVGHYDLAADFVW